MQLFLKLHSGMANSVDPNQTDLDLHCALYHFVRNSGVHNFRTYLLKKGRMRQIDAKQ